MDGWKAPTHSPTRPLVESTNCTHRPPPPPPFTHPPTHARALLLQTTLPPHPHPTLLLQVFKEFDHRPIGAASIGQVHRAVLRSGKHAGREVSGWAGGRVGFAAVFFFGNGYFARSAARRHTGPTHLIDPILHRPAP